MVSHLDLISTLYSLLRHPHTKREEIVAFQNKQLCRLVNHAYENVPYYRKLFDRNGIKPKNIQSAGDLSTIPITSKKDLQLLPAEEVVARGVDPKNLIARRTSGSSGEPLTIRRAWFEERLLGLIRLRTMHYLGQRLTDRVASIGLVRPKDPLDNNLPTKILQAAGLYRILRINSLLPPENTVDTLRHFRPDVLTGPPGVISRLAQIISDEDRLAIHPRFVRVNSEVLTPLMRRQIAEAFEAPVFDLYACHEFRVIAWECKETGELHTCDDSIIVEVIKDRCPAATGERGEVVGTSLHSFAMPFIRYRLGDIVTKGSETCKCGLPFSTIRSIQGRMIDYFPLPDGRSIHPYEIALILVYNADPWIRQYQLTQERVDRIVLQIVPLTTPRPQELIRLRESVSALLGKGVEFDVTLVPEINLEPTGKFRVSRSLLNSAYDGIDWEKPAS
jgi:phenylacetate-CoA ligase